MEEADILFKNTFSPTDKHYQMVFRNRIFGSTNLQAILLFGACGILLLLVLVPRLIYHQPLLDENNLSMFVVVLVLTALSALLYFGFPVFSSRAIAKNRKKQGLGRMSFETSFSDDGLMVHVSPDDRDQSAAYSDFTRVSTVSDMLILTTRAGQVVMLGRNSFSKGSEQELLAFLKQKCPHIKIR